ncbi:MAG: TIGR03905 family TSCPD domain-containing protein [Clostridia bacterium]|nr:TIGR03905 family TSCPD domain-containing protein [Clostridia bacterium]
MMYHYKTRGTCSTAIDIGIENGVITACAFERGCRGNTQGLSRMVIGRKAGDVISLLRGIECRNGTSCPDQLSYAIEECMKASEMEAQ